VADSIAEEGALLRFDDEASNRAVVLEDDGRVAYAYLLVAKKIVTEVWLYNVAESPAVPEWRDRSKLPFLNPKAYCRSDKTLPRIGDCVSVRCVWHADRVELVLDDVLAARLAEGTKPGWSLLASKRGPLAMPLEG
jgi:hypothetical protein